MHLFIRAPFRSYIKPIDQRQQAIGIHASSFPVSAHQFFAFKFIHARKYDHPYVLLFLVFHDQLFEENYTEQLSAFPGLFNVDRVEPTKFIGDPIGIHFYRCAKIEKLEELGL
jgi:hypothetical protein